MNESLPEFPTVNSRKLARSPNPAQFRCEIISGTSSDHYRSG